MMRLVLIILAVLIPGCGDKGQQLPYKTGELLILTRVGSTTYSVDATGGASGFDYDLARLLAQELGLKSRIVVAANDNDILQRLKSGEGDLAAAWLTAVDDAQIRNSTPYFQSQNVLITHEASLPLTGIEQLAHKTIHVVAGSRQETALLAVKDKVPDLIIAADQNHNELDLMEGVATQRYEATLVNNAEFDIGSNHYPELQDSLEVGPAHAIVWLFAPGVDPELISRANTFLEDRLLALFTFARRFSPVRQGSCAKKRAQ